MQGDPASRVIDTGADMTIIIGNLFKMVTDKRPHTYDWKQLTLDGRLDLDITFEDKTMTTPIYLTMDTFHQLLLSEGDCSQLGIVN